MAGYVDGYVLPIPKKHLQVYRRMAQKAGKIWREHGALDYKECAGDDLNITMGVSFPRQMKVNQARQSCSRISCLSRVRIAIASMPKS